MTIFGEVARKVIHERVRAACVASADADISTSTTFFTQIGLGRIGLARDLTLSKAKRELIEKLLPEIDKSTGNAEDEIVCEHFQTLIRHCKTETLSAANSNPIKFGKGTTEPVLDNLITILQTIFDKLTELHLLNIPHDHDPLNSFRYYVALYYAKKIAADSEASSWDLNLAKKIELTKEQEKLVESAITTCTRSIEKIDADKNRLDEFLKQESSQREDLEHKEMRRSYIALSVSWLQRHNNDVCKLFAPVQIPGLDYFDPNDHILTKCLVEAVTAIGHPDCAPRPALPEQINVNVAVASEVIKPISTPAPRLLSPVAEASTTTSSELIEQVLGSSSRVASPVNAEAMLSVMLSDSSDLDDLLTEALTPVLRQASSERLEEPVVQALVKQSSISDVAPVSVVLAVAVAAEADIDSAPQQSKSGIGSITVKPAASAPWPALTKAQKRAQKNQLAPDEVSVSAAMRKGF